MQFDVIDVINLHDNFGEFNERRYLWCKDADLMLKEPTKNKKKPPKANPYFDLLVDGFANAKKAPPTWNPYKLKIQTPPVDDLDNWE
jgi:hypothetical protein